MRYMREISKSTKAPVFWAKFAWLFWIMVGVVIGCYFFPAENVVVDRIVERRVEVPVERIVEKRVEVPVDRIVEKRVEVPVEKIIYRDRPPAAVAPEAGATPASLPQQDPEALADPARKK